MTTIRLCPQCGNDQSFSTERRPNGNTGCLACGFRNPTAKFQVEVMPMPSPTKEPKAYMLALAEKLKAEGGRQMTQGECKNLELAESTLRMKKGSPADFMAVMPDPGDTPPGGIEFEAAPGAFDSLTRVELVKKCEGLTTQLAELLNSSIDQAEVVNSEMNELNETTASHATRIKVLDDKLTAMADGADTAWGIIANASNWMSGTDNSSDWVKAAIRWRDEFYHPMLDALLKPKSATEPLMANNAGPDVTTPPADGAWVPRWVAITLWGLLDDIDTASDMFKDNYKGLANYVYKKQRQRFQVGTSDGYEVQFNGYSDPPREVRDCGTLEGLNHLAAAAAGYIKKLKVDHHFAEVFMDSLADYPEIVALIQPPSVPNCPPCPTGWEKLRDSANAGEISEEELFSMGFSRWNEAGDEAEGEDLIRGGVLWLMPVNWYDELPKDFDFVTIHGTSCRVDAGASKDSRMGYLAFGLVRFQF